MKFTRCYVQRWHALKCLCLRMWNEIHTLRAWSGMWCCEGSDPLSLCGRLRRHPNITSFASWPGASLPSHVKTATENYLHERVRILHFLRFLWNIERLFPRTGIALAWYTLWALWSLCIITTGLRATSLQKTILHNMLSHLC